MLTLNPSLHAVPVPDAGGGRFARRDNAGLPAGEDASARKAGTASGPAGSNELSAEEQRQLDRLQRVDREVRAHEQAHVAAGQGVVTSGASFSYTYGPDGKAYATAGEVGVDTSAEKDPQANIDKGIRIQAAALAPKDPSPQDYKVAAIGSQLEAQGRADLAQERSGQGEQSEPGKASTTDPLRRRVEQAYSTVDNKPVFSAVA